MVYRKTNYIYPVPEIGDFSGTWDVKGNCPCCGHRDIILFSFEHSGYALTLGHTQYIYRCQRCGAGSIRLSEGIPYVSIPIHLLFGGSIPDITEPFKQPRWEKIFRIVPREEFKHVLFVREFFGDEWEVFDKRDAERWGEAHK